MRKPPSQTATDRRTWPDPEYVFDGQPVSVLLRFSSGKSLVTCREHAGRLFLGGDILIASGEELTRMRKEKAAEKAYGDVLEAHVMYGAAHRWPGGTIPFDIDPTVPAGQQADIATAVNDWNTTTPLTLVQRTTEADFVMFQPDVRCFSRRGMVGGQQPIGLAPACTVGNIRHEIGHAVGLVHEHQRWDRDLYVQINSHNIQPNAMADFAKVFGDGEFGPYDYDSLMHYSATAFAINPATPTIISPAPIGQRTRVSARDAEAIQFWYFTDHATVQTDTPANLNSLFPTGTYEGLHIAASRWARAQDQISGAIPTHRTVGGDHEMILIPRGSTFRRDVNITDLTAYFDTSTREGYYVACHRWGRANGFLSAFPDFEIGPNGARGVYCILKGAGNNHDPSVSDLAPFGGIGTIEDCHRSAHLWARAQGYAGGLPYFEQTTTQRGITCLSVRA